jgi:hypothetical protein
VAWESLPEGEKEKDRQAVRSLPRLVALAGLQIYRRGGKEPSATSDQRSAISNKP